MRTEKEIQECIDLLKAKLKTGNIVTLADSVLYVDMKIQILEWVLTTKDL